MKSTSYIKRPNQPLQIYAALFLIVRYEPVLFLPLFSFNDSIYVKFPLTGLTFQWYVELMEHEPVWAALMNSLKVGVTTSLISTGLGIFAAKAITRYGLPAKGPIVGYIMLPLVVPGIIFGVAPLVLISRMGIPLSLYTVTIGHVIVCLPFAIATMFPRFEGFDSSVEEASADLGENAWWTFWRVTFPMVFPGILASFLLTFTVSFDEFLMAFFLSGTDPTLPMYIWSQLRFPKEFPSILALASIILVVSFFLVFLGQWINRDARAGAVTGE